MMNRATADRIVSEIIMDSDRADEGGDAFGVLLTTLPPIMGSKDAAEVLGVKVPNLRKQFPNLEPVTRISGGTIPVYLAADVERVRAERAARRAETAG